MPRTAQPAPDPTQPLLRYRAPWRMHEPAEGYEGVRADEPNRLGEADIRPGSWDPEARTIELVWTTGARVLRRDWWTGELWYEELSTDPKHVRLERLNSGAPFLDSHMSWGNRDVLGVHVDGSARMEGGQGLAKVRFSRAPSKAETVEEIADGIIRKVSTGYRIHEWAEVGAVIDGKFVEGHRADRKKGEIPVMRAVDWEPYENSAVPLPADNGAGFRGLRRTDQEAPVNPKTAPRRNTRADDETCPECEGKGEDCTCDDAGDGEGDEEARAALAAAEKAGKRAGRAAERARIAGIELAAKHLRLSDHPEVRKLIDGETPLARAQSRLFELAAERDDSAGIQPHVRVELGQEDGAKRLEGFENAILHRVGSAELNDNGRQYRGLSVGEMLRLHLARSGRIDMGASISEVAERLLGRSGMHHSDDFPILLQNVANKSLRDRYERLERTFVPFSRRVTVKDFKPVTRAQLGEGSALSKKIEGAEIKMGTIGEGKEEYAIATYAGGYHFTREMLINDDMDAFSRLPALQAARIVDMENLVAWTQVTSNPAMGDGTALFHADHKNLVSAAAPGATALNVARKAMRTQTGLDGAKIRVTPRFILTPENLLGAWEQLYSPAYKPTAKETAMTDALMRLQIISEPLLDDASANNWYIAGDPGQIDTLEYAYLQGAEGPQMATEIEFGVGVKFLCFEDFGAKWIDWRSIVKNPYAG